MSLKGQASGGGAAATDEYVCEGDGDDLEGVLLATGSYDHTIKFWQAYTGDCVRTLQHGDSVSDNNEVFRF